MNISKNIGYVYHCEQCGRCSSACPITGINGFSIRKIIRIMEIYGIKELTKTSLIWECLACGRCEESCPNGVKILEVLRLVRRNVPKTKIPKGLAPCIEACPAKINIPSFIRRILDNKENSALEVIINNAPIPGILGRVCGKTCESKCRRGQVDSPVSICSLKRYIFDSTKDIFGQFLPPKIKINKNILVIGSGPAGLSASYFLRKKGYFVTILEKREKAGGMLRYGIPNYRLPESVLDIEINRIIRMGVILRTNEDLNYKSSNELKIGSFDAIFISTGLSLAQNLSLGISDISDNRIFLGLDFLAKVNSNLSIEIGESIVVIGGGSVALDVAMSALRLGAKKVTIVALENRRNMPADPLELEIALEEGIILKNSWGVKDILFSKNFVKVNFVNCLSVFDSDYLFDPKFGDKNMSIIVDQIIVAIGQTSDNETMENLFKQIGINLQIKGNFIPVDLKYRVLRHKNIFAGGDIVSGPGSVVKAVSSGKKAALSIDSFLGGNGKLFLDNELNNIEIFIEDPNCTLNSSFKDRQIETKLLVEERKHNFCEISCGLDYKKVKIEASRCLRCDLEKGIVS